MGAGGTPARRTAQPLAAGSPAAERHLPAQNPPPCRARPACPGLLSFQPRPGDRGREGWPRCLCPPAPCQPGPGSLLTQGSTSGPSTGGARDSQGLAQSSVCREHPSRKGEEAWLDAHQTRGPQGSHLAPHLWHSCPRDPLGHPEPPPSRARPWWQKQRQAGSLGGQRGPSPGLELSNE